MNKGQIISQLKGLKREAKAHIDEEDENDIFRADYEALDFAIKIIENSMQVKEYEILKEKYLVYINENEEGTDFYISKKGYGIIRFMIGLDLNKIGISIEDFINDKLIEWIYNYNLDKEE